MLWPVFVFAALVLSLRGAPVDEPLRITLGQEHGPDAECRAICVPEDIEWPKTEELPTYTCEGACTHGETDPCAEGKEATDCGEWCRKACCRCRSAHCP